MVRSAAMTDSFASFDLTLGVGAKLGALSRDESDSSRAGRSCGPKVGSFRETVCSFQIAMARTPIQSGALTACNPLKCLGIDRFRRAARIAAQNKLPYCDAG